MDTLPAGAQLPRDKDEDNKHAQEEQMRRDVMATVLDTAARERCVSPSVSTRFLKSDLSSSIQDCTCQSRTSQAD